MAVTAQATGTWTDLKGSTFTVTIASPGVVTISGNGLSNGDAIVLQTTGTLPTGLTAGTTYYVVNNGVDGSGKFRLATAPGGSDINTSGSQSGTHTVTTVEHILTDINVAGVFTLYVDKNNLADGDLVEIRTYQIILTGGTRRVVYKGSSGDTQPADDKIAATPPLMNELTDTGSVRYTIKQTAGTARAYDWKVLKA